MKALQLRCRMATARAKRAKFPQDMAEAAQKAHEALVEMVAEGNDALMEEFFEKGTLPVEHILEGLNVAVREMRLFPVLCASALHNIGSDQILNSIVDNLPAPTDRGDRYRQTPWQRGSAQDRGFRAGFGVCIQDHSRSFRRAHHLLQDLFRRAQERRQSAQRSTWHRRAAGAHLRAHWERP